MILRISVLLSVLITSQLAIAQGSDKLPSAETSKRNLIDTQKSDNSLEAFHREIRRRELGKDDSNNNGNFDSGMYVGRDFIKEHSQKLEALESRMNIMERRMEALEKKMQ